MSKFCCIVNRWPSHDIKILNTFFSFFFLFFCWLIFCFFSNFFFSKKKNNKTNVNYANRVVVFRLMLKMLPQSFKRKNKQRQEYYWKKKKLHLKSGFLNVCSKAFDSQKKILKIKNIYNLIIINIISTGSSLSRFQLCFLSFMNFWMSESERERKKKKRNIE